MAGSEPHLIGRPLLASSLIIAVALAGCNLLPVSQGTLYAAGTEKTPASAAENGQVKAPGAAQLTPHRTAELTPEQEQSQLMYELMIAELAGRRGYVDIATEGYVNAAQRTDDPRVSERATKLAVWGRRWQQAEIVGKRWAALEPQNSEVHQLLAQVYMRQGDSKQAAEELALTVDNLVAGSGADAMQGDYAAAMADIYQFLLREPNRGIAIETMQQMSDMRPEDAHAYLVLGQLAFDSRDYSQALTAVDKSIELKPTYNTALMLRAQILTAQGKAEHGFDELREALKQSPDDVELHLGYARLLVEAGRYDEAEAEFEVCYKLGRDSGHAMINLGLLALESRRNGAAQKYFSRLLELKEYTDEAHFYLARIADSRRDLNTAIEHYEQVGRGEYHMDAQIRAAELQGVTGNLDLGRARLQQLGAGNPTGQLKQRLLRAEGRMLLDAGQPAAAVEVLSEGLEAFPDNSDIRYARALAAERAGDKAMFESDLQTLINADPENAHAMNALGYYYADENIKLDEAEELLVKANRLLPKDPAILDSLGWLRFRRGEYSKALELLKQAYALLKDPEIAAHLGEVLWVTGDQKSAADLWSRALLERPDDPVLKSVMERYNQ